MKIWMRLRCFLWHDLGAWGTHLPQDFPHLGSFYFQYRGCRRCGLIRERMIR